MIDIVFPAGNEKDFIKTAEWLGIEGLCLAYDYNAKTAGSFAAKHSLLEGLRKGEGIKLFLCALADEKMAARAERAAELVIIRNPLNGRHVIEHGLGDVIFELEVSTGRDFIYQRNSGLNHVLAEFAAKSGIIIGLSFNSILEADDKERVRILGRMMQNLRLCRKYKVKTVICSFARKPLQMRAPLDLKAFFISMGMEPGLAKQSLEAIKLKLAEKKDKESPDYIEEGVRLVD